jgi:hypothetical protein
MSLPNLKNTGLVLLIAWAALATLLWRNEAASKAQVATIQRDTTVDVNFVLRGDTTVVNPTETIYRTRPAQSPDTVYAGGEVDTVFHDTPCDSLRSYAFRKQLGDTLTIDDSITTRGRLLRHKLTYDLNVPVRTERIRETITQTRQPYKYRAYLGTSSDLSAEASFATPHWQFGYAYYPFAQAGRGLLNTPHQVRAQYNLLALFNNK